MLFVLDATYIFDRTGPDENLHHTDDTAANLHGELGTVVDTASVLEGGHSRPNDRPPSTTSSAPVT